VNGRIWDASFDPALGVEVRCSFQHWGFNAPPTPVQLNQDGTETVILLNVPPWGNRVAPFRWRTPLIAGHYCLKVACFHPDDRNTANNVGQENTDILEGGAGERLATFANIQNPLKHPIQVWLTTDTYVIDNRKWEFPLKEQTWELGLAPFDVRPRQGISGRFRRWAYGKETSAPQLVRYDYIGKDKLLSAQRAIPAGIPVGWTVTVDGDEGGRVIKLGPNEARRVELSITPPPTAQRGDTVSVNFNAVVQDGGPLGGVTVRIKVT
jgi:hypothetical protein